MTVRNESEVKKNEEGEKENGRDEGLYGAAKIMVQLGTANHHCDWGEAGGLCYAKYIGCLSRLVDRQQGSP